MIPIQKYSRCSRILVKIMISWRSSRPLFPEACLDLAKVTKEYFMWIRTLQRFRIHGFFTRHELLRGKLSLVWTRLSTPTETAPYVLSWFAEWMIRSKSSTFEASAVKCMVSLVFLLFRIPRLRGLILAKIESSNRCCICAAMEFHRANHFSKSKERPMSLRESLHVVSDVFGIWNTLSFIVFLIQTNVVEHWHGDNWISKIHRVECFFFANHP